MNRVREALRPLHALLALICVIAGMMVATAGPATSSLPGDLQQASSSQVLGRVAAARRSVTLARSAAAKRTARAGHLRALRLRAQLPRRVRVATLISPARHGKFTVTVASRTTCVTWRGPGRSSVVRGRCPQSAPVLAAAPAPAPTAPSPVPASPTGTSVVDATFDSLPTGGITPRNFQSQLGGTYNQTSPYDDTSVVAATGHGKVLRTTFDANTMHSLPSGANNGATFFIALPKVLQTACMSYDIRFDANFDWSLGGKLPGLEGVAPGVSPGAPTGGNYAGDLGWSGRMMWLGPKAYSWAGPTNMAVSYMYNPKQTSAYGDNVRWNKPFLAGQWHTVKQCFTMNTPGRADGILQGWMNGTRVVDNHAFTFRTRSDVGVSHLVWHLFRGGGTSNWAGSRTNWIDIDNVRVTAGSPA